MLPSSGVLCESGMVQKEIVTTLLAYTQPDVSEKMADSSDDSFESTVIFNEKKIILQDETISVFSFSLDQKFVDASH